VLERKKYTRSPGITESRSHGVFLWDIEELKMSNKTNLYKLKIMFYLSSDLVFKAPSRFCSVVAHPDLDWKVSGSNPGHTKDFKNGTSCSSASAVIMSLSKGNALAMKRRSSYLIQLTFRQKLKVVSIWKFTYFWNPYHHRRPFQVFKKSSIIAKCDKINILLFLL
jgi:hypothetical protein